MHRIKSLHQQCSSTNSISHTLTTFTSIITSPNSHALNTATITTILNPSQTPSAMYHPTYRLHWQHIIHDALNTLLLIVYCIHFILMVYELIPVSLFGLSRTGTGYLIARTRRGMGMRMMAWRSGMSLRGEMALGVLRSRFWYFYLLWLDVLDRYGMACVV